MSIELPFDPFPLLPGSHQQTIFGSFLSLQRQPLSFRKLVELPDKDKIALEVSTPKKWKPTDPTVILIHGLCGSHKSPYLVRITKKLEKKGIRAIRLNLRGCGSGRGLAKKIYHCGQSEDVLAAIKDLHEEHPLSPTILVGFSMGGNIALKLAGELKDKAEKYLIKTIGISPPVDLKACIELFSLPHNRMYERYFLKRLKADVYYRHKKFPELGELNFPKKLGFKDFDEIYTAPQAGFINANDYYRNSGALNKIEHIAIDCDILISEDDPIICSRGLNEVDLPANIRYFKTKKGGHLGYLGKKPFHWIDEILLQWIQECL